MFKAQHHLLTDRTGVGVFVSMGQLSLPPTRYTFCDSNIYTTRIRFTIHIPCCGCPTHTLSVGNAIVHDPPQSLTALLPVLAHTLEQMYETLEPFLNEAPDTLREVVILCPESIFTAVRRELQRTFSSSTFANHADVFLHPYHWTLSTQAAIDQATASVTTGWVLVMNESGLRDVDSAMRKVLLSPANVTYALGPTGSVLSLSGRNGVPSTPQNTSTRHSSYRAATSPPRISVVCS